MPSSDNMFLVQNPSKAFTRQYIEYQLVVVTYISWNTAFSNLARYIVKYTFLVIERRMLEKFLENSE